MQREREKVTMEVRRESGAEGVNEKEGGRWGARRGEEITEIQVRSHHGYFLSMHKVILHILQ